MKQYTLFMLLISMRKKRILVDGAKYYVCARINRSEPLFARPLMKDLFLKVLRQAKKKYTFSVFQYCIMNNHIHLIIRPLKKDSLSNILRWVFSVFAKRFNLFFNIHGHVWQDRFQSRIIHTLVDYVSTFTNIAMSPVSAGMVQIPQDWLHTKHPILPEGLRGG